MGLDETVERIRAIFEQYLQMRRAVVAMFIADPDSYVDPHAYLEDGCDRLPRPPLQFVPENGALVVPPADDAYIHRPAKTPEGQHVALALGYRPAASAVPTLSLEDCFWLYDATTAADVLYSEFGRVFYDADIAIARSRLGDVQFLQIM